MSASANRSYPRLPTADNPALEAANRLSRLLRVVESAPPVLRHGFAAPSIPAEPPSFAVIMDTINWPYRWRVKTRLPERFGSRCRVTARGKLNSIRVEFEDGFWCIASRWNVRRAVAGGK